jgi:hypothetical protein
MDERHSIPMRVFGISRVATSILTDHAVDT